MNILLFAAHLAEERPDLCLELIDLAELENRLGHFPDPLADFVEVGAVDRGERLLEQRSKGRPSPHRQVALSVAQRREHIEGDAAAQVLRWEIRSSANTFIS